MQAKMSGIGMSLDCVRVDSGDLGHMKKDGHKPEAYYHPTFEHMAHEARRKHERETLSALAGVAVRPYED